LPESNYEKIKNSWIAELDNDHLQDLEDLQLSKMIDYLSSVRLKLAETNAEERIQFNLLTQEALNLEFMIKDLLVLRRDKIINAVLRQRRPMGFMTLTEEEFYNRFFRGFEGHRLYMDEALAGNPSPTLKIDQIAGEKTARDDEEDSSSSALEYVLVQFIKPVDTAFLGLDEVTYGPYEVGQIATIPLANARTWLRDGTVTRIVTESENSG
jgi:hypothetical protein